MEYTFPNYYKEFHCTADACEDTCCAGWQIAVDKKSMQKYRSVQGSYRKKLRRSVNWLTATFKQHKNLRCAFLNNDNLCDMYANLGCDSLCKTCRLYPRHVEEFEGIREITLSISCPEVARILMNHTEPVHFLTMERDGEESYENFDPFLFSQLEDAREVMIEILQNRALPTAVRAQLIWGIAHDMQLRVDDEKLFSCFEVLEKYQTRTAADFVSRDLAQRTSAQKFSHTRKLFHTLEQMELLREHWASTLAETKHYLYANKTARDWENVSAEFDAWIQEHHFPWEIQKEQLLVYFLSTYFCGAVYDGRILAKAEIALKSVTLLEELLKSVWIRNEKFLDQEDVIELVYRYSREIEHSDKNLGILQK